MAVIPASVPIPALPIAPEITRLPASAVGEHQIRRLDAREVVDGPTAPLREHRCARPLRPLIFRPSVPVVDVDGISPASRPAEVYDKIGHYAVPKKTL